MWYPSVCTQLRQLQVLLMLANTMDKTVQFISEKAASLCV